MTAPKYPVQMQTPVSYEMKKELKEIAKEREMSLSELVRYWLAGSIKYWRES